MNSLHEQLLAAGYKHCGKSVFFNPHSDYFYQKRIKSWDDTLYFINVFYYGPEEVRNFGESFQWEAQLHLPDSSTLDLTYSSVDIEQVELLVKTIYNALDCIPYELREDD
jgi:hypothetical protein